MKRPNLLLAIALAVSLVLSACAPATPQVIEKVVTKEVQVPATPQVIEKVVTKEVQVPATPQVIEKEVEVPVTRGSITVLTGWGGFELDALQQTMLPFTQDTGVGVAFEYTPPGDLAAVLTTRVEAGTPPDMAMLPNPGQMHEFASQGVLVDLGTFMDMDQLKQDYAQAWLDLGSHEGALHGIFFQAEPKSLLWYNPKAFEAAGYKLPATWDELIALSDQIVADGKTPWAIGFEDGSGSGWPGTDWVEDILLRTGGPEIYDQWVAHEIPWTHPEVKKAWETFGQIVRNEKYLYGGTTGVVAISWADITAPLFTDPPGAYLHHQGNFIVDFFPEPESKVFGVDYDVFAFPPIDPKFEKAMTGGGSLMVVFNDTPQTQALMKYLASPEYQENWAGTSGRIVPNKRVSLDVYPNEITRKMAQMIVESEIFRYDGSDQMPAALDLAFRAATLDYVSGEDLDTVLEDLEAVAVDAYGQK
jgi:alpha-glucoside transport system substrate-binding protein